MLVQTVLLAMKLSHIKMDDGEEMGWLITLSPIILFSIGMFITFIVILNKKVKEEQCKRK
jgi:hypothetical protein